MTEEQLRDLTFGFRAARAAMAAVSVGAIDRLALSPCGAAEIAASCGLHPRGARTLLAALAAIGVVSGEGETFALDPTARSLFAAGGERSRRSIVLHDLWHFGLWARLEASLRSGDPVADRKGDAFFSDPVVLAQFFPNFARAMEETSRGTSRRLVRELKLAGDERLLDLGGGAGNFAIALARAHPRLALSVLDLPPVAREAEANVARAGLAERIAVRAADFRSDAVAADGARYDVALLSRVVMGLSDRDAAALLAKVRAALRPGGRAVLHEFRRGDGAAERLGALLDLDMLLLTGGAVRPAAALAALLEDAGFARVAARPFGDLGVLVEGEA